MSDFDNMNNNKENDNRSDDNSKDYNNENMSGHDKEQQAYDFCVEKKTDTSYNNYNPETNLWQYKGSTVKSKVKSSKKEWYNNKYLKFIGLAICFGLIASISFFGVQKVYFLINPEAEQNSVFLNSKKNYTIVRTASGTVKTESSSVIKDVISSAKPAIVAIDSVSTETSTWFGQNFNQEVKGSGSGIIIGKNEDELLIATNNHVVAGTTDIKATFIDGTKLNAVIKGTDVVADLAVITVDISDVKEDMLKKIKVASLGDSDKVNEGEMVIAIGNALGYGQSTTVGYISAKDRKVEVSDGYSNKKMLLLQTDAAINPGNSGGALLNIKGEVIGINTVKYASNEVEGMGYAIPISRANPIISELMSRKVVPEEEQGYLGILGADVTEDVAASINMPVGVFVNEVEKDSGAEKAGLIKGDIITAANDVEITSIAQLRDYVTCYAAGTKVKITYMRSKDGTYKAKEVTITLGKKPDIDSMDKSKKNSKEEKGKEKEK
jgi:serine protease Do